MKHLLVFLLIAMLFITAATAAQSCVAAPGAENLIVNGDLELGSGDVPECWYKTGDDSINNILLWVADPFSEGHGKVLYSEFTGVGVKTSFRWYQVVEGLEPNTWYELSADMAFKDMVPLIDLNQEMDEDSVAVGIAGATFGKLRYPLYIMGLEYGEWDEDVWVYRTYKEKSQGWAKLTTYFKTDEGVDRMTIRTLNYPKGKLYVDNLVLKKAGERNSFKKSGTLEFLKYKGKDFFPIVLRDYPVDAAGTPLSLSEIKAAGFNTVNALGYPSIKEASLENNLVLMMQLNEFLYKEGDSLDRQSWVYDPSHSINYQGARIIKERIDKWGNVENVENFLFFAGMDEITCKPVRRGALLPQLESFKKIKEYIGANAPGKYIRYNFCGNYSPYTGIAQHFADYYFPTMDIVTFNQNMPQAYPQTEKPRELGKGGEIARLLLDLSYTSGAPKNIFAVALGVREWSTWDGVHDSDNPYIGKLPFNLQRFQVWDQIINGATGLIVLNFGDNQYYDYRINLDKPLDDYHWQQIKTISKEAAALYDVLLEKDFYNEWQASDNRIEAMMKKHAGKIYLFTASTHYEDIHDVIITLNSQYTIKSVKALNDIINGDITNPIDRPITPATANSFVDDFVGDDGSHASAVSPGYAVHIYEIELSACGNGTCEAGETASCPQDCQECVDNEKLLGYISQWKRGEITMLTLMQKIRQRNTGEGCPTPP